MKRFALIVATTLLVAVAAPFLVPVAAAQTAPIPTLTLTIIGETNNSRQVFSKNLILLPEVPYNLDLTFHNGDPTMAHSFTINDVNGTPQIDSKILSPGAPNVTFSFTILSLTRIAYNGTQFTPEAAPGGGILFYCVPHRLAGMTGSIALAGLAPPPAEKGILLRAYWIGLIGIAVTLLWVIISYYIIKSSSRHFRDHAEHVRRGLP